MNRSQHKPQAKQKRPLSRRALTGFFFSAMALWLGLGSCTYHERFIIHIDEGKSFPCVGVARFAFVIEALEQGQDPLTSERSTDSFLDQNLFWSTASGTCQIPNDNGILLKNIPFGGQRKITIQAYDSSQELVAMGSSQPFVLEASGDNVQDVITLPLIRGCKTFNPQGGTCATQQPVGFGTLIIRFQAGSTITAGAQKLIFQVKVGNGQEDLIRRIELQDATIPDTIMLTNIPAGDGKAYEIFSLDTQRRVLQTWTGMYTIPATPQPSNPPFRPIPNLKPKTP